MRLTGVKAVLAILALIKSLHSDITHQNHNMDLHNRNPAPL